MGIKYITRHDSMGQALNTIGAVDTGSDGTTPGRIGVSGYRRIRQIISVVGIDGAHIIDTGNCFEIKLTGSGLVHDAQSFVVGGVANQETGTSVGAYYVARPAVNKYVDIPLKPEGGDVFVTSYFSGTDPGTPFISVTLGLEK